MRLKIIQRLKREQREKSYIEHEEQRVSEDADRGDLRRIKAGDHKVRATTNRNQFYKLEVLLNSICAIFIFTYSFDFGIYFFKLCFSRDCELVYIQSSVLF